MSACIVSVLTDKPRYCNAFKRYFEQHVPNYAKHQWWGQMVPHSTANKPWKHFVNRLRNTSVRGQDMLKIYSFWI